MAKIDIKLLFDDNGVQYITQGKNLKRGHINIKCPFCEDDPSHHLGINISTLAWSCWRDSDHRGVKINRLLRKLLNWPWDRIEALVGKSSKRFETEFDTFAAKLWAAEVEEDKVETKSKISFHPTFRKICDNGPTERFWDYLYSRGFYDDEIEEVCGRYNLRCCVNGYWGNRIILPITLDHDLVTWTGRDVGKNPELRYKNLAIKDSVLNTKHTIYNFDNAFQKRKGETLYILEGPFDVIKLDYFLVESNHSAVGLFNMNPTDEQISLLSELGESFKRFVVLLDNGELYSSMKVCRDLAFLGDVRLGSLPRGVKDPGDLTKELIEEHYL